MRTFARQGFVVLTCGLSTLACGASTDGGETTDPAGTDPMGNPLPGDDFVSPNDGPTGAGGGASLPGDSTDPARPPEALAYDEEYRCENYDTGWKGDGVCIRAPDPSVGFQLHYGPKDYDDPGDVASFVLEPGGEIDDSRSMITGNDVPILYQNYHIRLRPGTHHMILWGGNDGGGTLGIGGRYMFGAQGALGEEGGRSDRPDPNTLAPENEGVGYSLEASLPVRFNMHYVNTTPDPILREGWINIHYADPDDVTEIADPIAFFGALGLRIPPHSTQTVGGGCNTPANEIRVLSLSGHMHATGTRFSAWHHRSDGSVEKVYETHDWAEPAEIRYNSVTTNPEPGTSPYGDGGHSGILAMHPGERLSYECEMVNTTDLTLTFGNQTYEAEMCLLFGGYTPTIGGPWSCIGF
jgi:hypothetical protein